MSFRLFLTRTLPALLILNVTAAAAQVAPFSMNPDKPAAPPVEAERPQAPPAAPSATAAPFDMRRPSQIGVPTAPAPFNMTPPGTQPAPSPTVAQPRPAQPQPPAVKPTATPVARAMPRNEKPILPSATVRLDGEVDARSWAIYLTQDEAAASASLALGYRNAVVVMPEASRIRAHINGELVIDTPIASAQNIQRVILPVRAGLLRPGQNIVRLEVVQRHRTDCTVRATYELWTEVDSASTAIVFGENTPRFLRGLEDLPAVGVDATGATTIHVIAPKLYRPEMRDRLLRLVQMVSLRGRYAHPVVKVSETDPGRVQPGTIKVFLGPASELRGIMVLPPEAAISQPIALVTQDAGSPALVVSGPGWADLDTAINVIANAMVNNRPAERNSLDNASWMWPDTPTFQAARSVKFSDLGIPTQEFSGRRFRARFAINLPADFYANDYGEALLYLDAAYTPAVRPGSHIDLYVNDHISATMRITAKGDIFRRHPIRIPMRNFRPGINDLWFEAVLMTDADDRCPPGGTLSETSRFALFDTTSFELPTFGRIGRLPDLAAMSAGGFPLGNVPATFVLARQNPLLYATTGTLLARMARDSGTPVRATFANAAVVGDPTTVFIGAIDQLPQGMLSRVGVAERTRTIWQSTPMPVRTSSAAPGSEGQRVASDGEHATPERSLTDRAAQGSTDDIRKHWSESLSRRGFLQTRLDSFKAWVEQTFNLSVASLTLQNSASSAFEPPQRATLLLAQDDSEGEGTWTVMTARTESELADSTARMTEPGLWPQVSGRIVTLGADDGWIETQPVRSFTFVQTQPFSLFNLRLVAANWMSINILQYALLLVVCCAALGGTTYFLLKRLGRKS
ncbi:cellulose biosynthesis cyclic di-GMP-binding regulatory protein BcsB [Microvirga sp. 2MCAF38]|uniref:cellulose biosynthesis cyclic di-GMP-binding regulatory protein BcsB n=1 Tax=Microvirga sp. 2MCAF38 TaxID=3232989 RepID=UPI003F9B11B9